MKKIILFFIIFTFHIAGSHTLRANMPFENNLLTQQEQPKDTYQLKIYPNPCKTGQVTLEMNDQEIDEVRLINIAGEKVLQKRMEFGTNRYQLKLENVPNGIYFMRVKTTDNKTVVKKLVVSSR
ncbi:Por secretion system C-terminal sorting domain-containing protein [Tangfeifania diversioriginum]|uniref:Por secretion system C-terminal sorting domain-containing protein n=1 Tax=Tangfeifania diversioriginum TaxID=1168035 RepID=A0A1M6B186_9BACT|nr:T9SS type A sorting domain-containing protein [Tangfeifania diversioriginum]SHI42358.1 Por secretion system C-terminal sorting domain-containing protein [Tangfeifania diversioriginum]